MNRKKILIVGNTFFPENSPRAFRTTELAKEFSRLGNKVTIIIPKYRTEHFMFEKDFNVEIKNLGKRKFADININSSGTIIKLLKKLMILMIK